MTALLWAHADYQPLYNSFQSHYFIYTHSLFCKIGWFSHLGTTDVRTWHTRAHTHISSTYSLTQWTLWGNAGLSIYILPCSRAGQLPSYQRMHISLLPEHAHFPCTRTCTLSPCWSMHNFPILKNGHIFRTGTGMQTWPIQEYVHFFLYDSMHTSHVLEWEVNMFWRGEECILQGRKS